MIGSLKGRLAAHDKDSDRLLLEVAGVGYWVHVTSKDLAASISRNSDDTSSANSSRKKPAELHFFTEQVVREDSIGLYGFGTQFEVQSFTILLGIPGIGPQMAMAVLSTFSPQELQTVLLDEDIDSLCLVPGIGTKRARQLLAVLKDRFEVAEVTSSAAPEPSSVRAEVRAALSELGYSTEEIRLALAEVADQLDGGADGDGATDTEAVLKQALAVLAQ